MATKKPKKVVKQTHIGPPIKYTVERIDQLCTDMVAWAKKQTGPFFLVEFASANDTTMIYLNKLALQYPLIRDSIDLCKALQESQLSKALFNKDYPSSGVIFALKNCCGWRDSHDVNATVTFKPIYIGDKHDE